MIWLSFVSVTDVIGCFLNLNMYYVL